MVQDGDVLMADQAGGKRWGCIWTLLIMGSLLTFWVGGCFVGDAVNARRASSVKMGMTPAEVKELLGQPVQTMTMMDGTYEYSYRGFGARDRIDVSFDGAFKVIGVRRYSLPPHWLRHMVG
jgi:hypothetical protein